MVHWVWFGRKRTCVRPAETHINVHINLAAKWNECANLISMHLYILWWRSLGTICFGVLKPKHGSKLPRLNEFRWLASAEIYVYWDFSWTHNSCTRPKIGDFNNLIFSTPNHSTPSSSEGISPLKTENQPVHCFGIQTYDHFIIRISRYLIRIQSLDCTKRLRNQRSMCIDWMCACVCLCRCHWVRARWCRLLLNILEQREFEECTYKKVDSVKRKYKWRDAHTISMQCLLICKKEEMLWWNRRKLF